MKDSEIVYQLGRLAEALPLDRVDIWVCWFPEKTLKYTAFVSAREPLGSASETGLDLCEVVNNLLAEVRGKRGPEHEIAAKQQQIDKMRAELAKLEQEVEPVLGAIALERIKNHENP